MVAANIKGDNHPRQQQQPHYQHHHHSNSISIISIENLESLPINNSFPESTTKTVSSSLSLKDQEEKPICRICHCSNEDIVESQSINQQQSSLNNQLQHNNSKKKWLPKNFCDNSFNNVNDPYFLITPCYCTGSLQYVHHKCLQQWIRSSNHKYCELCKYSFKLKTKSKPLLQWECLNMSGGELRKLIFHIIFNLVSMLCVFWSIYVIGERASFELSGRLGWKFWIKMLVIMFGCICGMMFLFFQLKLYLSILARWKQYNQIIVIENVCKYETTPILNVPNIVVK